MSDRKFILVLSILFLLFFCLSWFSFHRFLSDSSSFPREEAFVVKVVDGDSLLLADGRVVRLIGVNALEGVNDSAKFRLEELVLNKKVFLERDVSDVDSRGEFLRYVFLENGSFVNELLLSERLVVPMIKSPDKRYAKELLRAYYGAH